MSGKRPNLLFIMDDQHRHDWLGCATDGARHVRTPHIDALAARGTRFTQTITSAPLCAPSRIGLASGCEPPRFGVLSNDAYLPLSPQTTPYYARLRDSGYRVGCVGKLDLAKPDGYNGRDGDLPRTFSWGFTHPVECEGKMHAGSSITPIGPYTNWLAQCGLLKAFHRDYAVRRGDSIRQCHDSVLPTEAFEDCYIGRRSARWIDDISDDAPWHLSVSFVGPHDPFDPPEEYSRRWRKISMPDAISGDCEDAKCKPNWIRQRDLGLSAAEVEVTRRQYSAAVECIDDQVGLILDAVERRGMMDDTVIVFSSDHGEMLGDHGLYAKACAYEASLRIPLILAGPGLPAGAVSDALVELIDLNPTLCELAGLPEQKGIDARSFLPVLRGEEREHREVQAAALAGFRCVRTREWKWIDNGREGNELYHLQSDPEEVHNVVGDHLGAVTELTAKLRKHYLWDPTDAYR
ncbi:MAG: sulfatase-like hydrolase/transferase [Candidatus Latescibacterota bacterium]|nr:sulfatase-like hydrolase/transferase [Candidatus Latescibacterota bacterium]